MNDSNAEQPTIPLSSPAEGVEKSHAETYRTNDGGNGDDPTTSLESRHDSDPAPTIHLAAPGPGPADARAKIRYFGEYELLEEIARGGMGVVYKARQLKLNRLVALKMILSGHLASEDDVQRFHSEAEAAAHLDHPGIVSIYEVGDHENQHYFSMAYVDGPSLSRAVAQGPLPSKVAAQIAKAIAEAMTYAHDRGVIHRDLKPANILLSKVNEQRSATVFLKVEGIDAGWYEPKIPIWTSQENRRRQPAHWNRPIPWTR